MATTTEPRAGARAAPVEQRIALRGVDRETFRKLHRAIDDQGILVAYNRGDLELISPGPVHERWKGLIDRLIVVVTEELGIPFKSMGSTTWGGPDAERAVEADECYFLTEAKLAAAAHGSEDIADYPPPDVALEIDVSCSRVDRPAIDPALGVPEVWRFDGEALRIDRLQADGTYRERPESRFLPIRPEEVVRWVLETDSRDQTAWARQLRAWVPRRDPTPRRRRPGLRGTSRHHRGGGTTARTGPRREGDRWRKTRKTTHRGRDL